MPQVLLYAMQAMDLIPQIMATATTLQGVVQAVTTHVGETNAALKSMEAEKRDPSDQEWADLNDKIAALRQQLHAAG